MNYVRLSGTVPDPDDHARSVRARLLFLLHESGWDILNSNGDQRITLSNIEKTIIESEAFVFTPKPSMEDMFKAISIFVGYQTLDKNLAGKPTVILNDDGSWDRFFKIIAGLHEVGTVRQDYRDYLLAAATPEEIPARLHEARNEGTPEINRIPIKRGKVMTQDVPPPDDLRGNVCVFCSASLENPSYLRDGEAFGTLLAKGNYGCISGAGKSGIMGAVVRGAVAAGGWAAGSNVPHIIELEGLPEGLSELWLRDNIYTRMEVMIENSDAFVIFPGGTGTVQELMALLIFKQEGNVLMTGKPIVIFNRRNEQAIGFWEILIDLLKEFCGTDDFRIATSLDEIEEILDQELPTGKATSQTKSRRTA